MPFLKTGALSVSRFLIDQGATAIGPFVEMGLNAHQGEDIACFAIAIG